MKYKKKKIFQQGIHRKQLSNIWDREVEKAIANPIDKRDSSSKKLDPWGNEAGTISVLVDENGKEVRPTHEIPSGEVEIVFGPNFSFFDIPALIFKTECLKNEFYQNPYNIDLEKRNFFISLGKPDIFISNWSRKIAASYEKKFASLLKSSGIETETRKQVLWALAEFLLKWHELLDKININDAPEDERLFCQQFKGKKTETEIFEILSNELEKPVYQMTEHFGETEILRSTDLIERLTSCFTGKKFNNIKKIYEKKSGSLINFNNPFTSIFEAKKQLHEARFCHDQNSVTEIIQNIARILHILIFSEQIIPYKTASISFKDLSIEGTGNCMLAHTLLPHLFLNRIFDIETKQIYTFCHSFLGILLHRDKIWNFEKNIMTQIENRPGIQVLSNGSWFEVSDFNTSYTAATLAWQKNYTKDLAEQVTILKRAISLLPEDPDLYLNLGNTYIRLANKEFIQKDQYSQKAETALKKAAELTDYRHTAYLFCLFLHYKRNSLQPEKLLETTNSIMSLIKDKQNVTADETKKLFPDFIAYITKYA
jgi:hypothetical protein